MKKLGKKCFTLCFENFYWCYYCTSFSIFRLKYTPTPTRKDEPNGFSEDDDTPLRKRRRMFYDAEEYEDFAIKSTIKGDIVISEVCPSGSFVKLQNRGKEVNISSKSIVSLLYKSNIYIYRHNRVGCFYWELVVNKKS